MSGPSEGTPHRAADAPECELDRVLDELRQARGLDLRGYRRPTLRQRLAARMEQLDLSDPAAYLERLRSDPAEGERLIGMLAVTVTSFFRDPLVFEVLAQRVLPEILQRKSRRRVREIRFWCAGCATGEEAYSLAILTHEALEGRADPWTPLIFATDINGEALEMAGRALYRREKLRDVKLRIFDEYFAPAGEAYRVRPAAANLVKFSLDDLTQTDRLAPAESVFGAFDLVMCRNVIIYFSSALQEAVLDKLCRSLGRGGYLVLGGAEFLTGGLASRFRTVDERNRIFQKI